MKITSKFFDPTDITTLVNKGTGKHVIADGLTTIPIYKGKLYSIKDVVNKDGTVNVRKAKKIMKEVAEYFGGKKFQDRLENPIWHKDDPNTWLHTKKVAKLAWQIPVPEGYTKQDQMVAALGHDFGKMLSGDGHAEVSYNLIKLIFPDATDKQLNAIRKHMSGFDELADKLELATKYADVGVIPGADLTTLGLTPEEISTIEKTKWFKKGGTLIPKNINGGPAFLSELIPHIKERLQRLKISPLPPDTVLLRGVNSENSIDIYRTRLKSGGVKKVQERGALRYKPSDIRVALTGQEIRDLIAKLHALEHPLPKGLYPEEAEALEKIRRWMDEGNISQEEAIIAVKELMGDSVRTEECLEYIRKKDSLKLKNWRDVSRESNNSSGFSTAEGNFVWAPNKEELEDIYWRPSQKQEHADDIKYWQITLPHEFEHAFLDGDIIYSKFFKPKHAIPLKDLINSKFSEEALLKMQKEMKELIGISPTSAYLTTPTELLARGTQIKNWLGITNPEYKLTAKDLKEAAVYYTEAGPDNNMTEFFNSIVDWDKAAEFLSYATVATGAVALGGMAAMSTGSDSKTTSAKLGAKLTTGGNMFEGLKKLLKEGIDVKTIAKSGFSGNEKKCLEALENSYKKVITKYSNELGTTPQEIIKSYSINDLQEDILANIEFPKAKVKGASFNTAEVFSPSTENITISNINFEGPIKLDFSELSKNGRLEIQKVSEIIDLKGGEDIKQLGFTKSGPKYTTLENSRKIEGPDHKKGNQKASKYIKDLEVEAFKKEIIVPTAETAKAKPEQLDYLKKHGTAGIVENPENGTLNQSFSTYKEGFTRLNETTIYAPSSGAKIKLYLVHEGLGHGLENFLDPKYLEEFLGFKGLPIPKDTKDKKRIMGEVRATLLEAKFFLWRLAKKAYNKESITPDELNSFIAKVSDSDLETLFKKLNHLGEGAAGEATSVAKSFLKDPKAYRERLGKLLGITAVGTTAAAGAAGAIVSDKNGGALNKFQMGGELEYEELPQQESSWQIDTGPYFEYSYLLDYENALEFDEDLNRLLKTRKIKNGELSEKAEEDLQRKYNLDKRQLDQTLKELLETGLAKALEQYTTYSEDSNNLDSEEAEYLEKGGNLVPKFANAGKILSELDLKLLKEKAMLETAQALVPKSLARKTAEKLQKSKAPKIEFTEELILEKQLKLLKAKEKATQISSSIQDFISPEEVKIYSEKARGITEKSAMEATTYDFVTPDSLYLLLSGTSSEIKLDLVVELQKAADISKNSDVIELAKLVTSSYLTGQLLPSEFVADLTGILKRNYISKSGKASFKKLNLQDSALLQIVQKELLDCLKSIETGTYKLTKRDAYRINKNGLGKALKVNNEVLEDPARKAFNKDIPRILDYYTSLPELFIDDSSGPLAMWEKLSMRNFLESAQKRNELLVKYPFYKITFLPRYSGYEFPNKIRKGNGKEVITYLGLEDPSGIPLGTYFAAEGEGRLNIPAVKTVPRKSNKLLLKELSIIYDENPEIYEQLLDGFISKNTDLLNFISHYYPNEFNKFNTFIRETGNLEKAKNIATHFHHKEFMSYQLSDFLVKAGYDKDKALLMYEEFRQTPEYLLGFYNLPAWAHLKKYGIHNAPGTLPTSRVGEVLSNVRRGMARSAENADKQIKLLDRLRLKEGTRAFTSDTIWTIKKKRAKLTPRSKDSTKEKVANEILKLKENAIVQLYKSSLDESIILQLIQDIVKAKKGLKLIPKAQSGGISKLKNGVKKVAHYINEDGKEVIPYHIGTAPILAVLDIQRAHPNWTKELCADFALKNYYKNAKEAGDTKANRAALLALTSGLAPFAAIPDIVYDWAAAIDEPSNSNTAHAVVNHGSDIAKVVTPGFKYDDYLAKGLELLGNVDDAASSSDYNIFKFLDKSKSDKNGTGAW